jgi:hypothetical protein
MKYIWLATVAASIAALPFVGWNDDGTVATRSAQCTFGPGMVFTPQDDKPVRVTDLRSADQLQKSALPGGATVHPLTQNCCAVVCWLVQVYTTDADALLVPKLNCVLRPQYLPLFPLRTWAQGSNRRSTRRWQRNRTG